MDYIKMKKQDLVELCKLRGINALGKASELSKRLIEQDKKNLTPSIEFDSVIDNNLERGETILSEELERTEQSKYQKNNETGVLSRHYYYLHIKAANLYNYFNFGYFYPLALDESKVYKNENRLKDILYQFPYYIILSKNAINSIENDDVLIELNTSGLDLIEYSDRSFVYTAHAIPISRVMAINFATKELRNTFIASVSTFPDAFVPLALCKTIAGDISVHKLDFENIKLPFNPEFSAWRKKLDLFDKILGMFAYMKNAGVFSLQYENQLTEYTNGFFGALYKLNNTNELAIFKENPLLTYIITSDKIELTSAYRYIFKQIITRILKNEVFDFGFAFDVLDSAIKSAYASDQEKSELNTISSLFSDLKSLKISHKQLLGNELIRRKHPAMLALALLVKFSNKSRQNTDKQAVRNLFIDNELQFRQTEIEFLLAILGFYYGYKSMIKQDTNIKFENRKLDFFVGEFQSIKFSAATYLEKFIIETIFQFSTSLIPTKDTFNFLKTEVEKPSVIVPSLNNNSEQYINESFQIYDKVIYRYTRNSKQQQAIDLINDRYGNIIATNSYLLHFLFKNIKWDKAIVLELINKNLDENTINELIKVIELDTDRK